MNQSVDLPTFCIGIPFFNSAVYLERCINSILSQDYPTIFVICLDDGSSDNGMEIIQKKHGLDNRFILLSNNANKGISFSRQRIVDSAKGDYFLWVDSDDELLPGALWRLAASIREGNYGKILIQNVLVFSGHNKYCLYPRKKKNFTKEESIRLSLIDKEIRDFSCSFAIPVAVIKTTAFPAERTKYIDDLFVSYQYFLKSNGAVRLKDCGYLYIERSGSDSHTPDFYLRMANTLSHLSDFAKGKYEDVFALLVVKKAIFHSIYLVGLCFGEQSLRTVVNKIKLASLEARKIKWNKDVKKIAGSKIKIQRFFLLYFPVVFIFFYKRAIIKRHNKVFR
jgi:glycosyltransferase involved in cell wall biosynthesis